MYIHIIYIVGFPWWLSGKESTFPCRRCRKQVWSLGREDALEKEMVTYSILAWRSPLDRGAWWAAVHGITKSWIQFSNQHAHTYTCIYLSIYMYIYIQFLQTCKRRTSSKMYAQKLYSEDFSSLSHINILVWLLTRVKRAERIQKRRERNN